MRQPESIFVCRCVHSHVIDRARTSEVLGGLRAAGVEVESTPDLCGMAARRDPSLKRLVEAGRLSIVACYPRAVRALFQAAGAPLPAEDVRIFNMRTQDAGEILRALTGDPPHRPAPTAAEEPPAPRPEEWLPWFPVIDVDRCRNCRQCLNFCLFGVYELNEDGKVVVANPANCKTYCPACARICPAAAIIFPKHDAAPINGAEPAAEDATGAKVRVDVAELLRGDAYAVLRRRQQAGRGAAGGACTCAESAGEALGIPREVLDGNPELSRMLGGAARPPPGPGEEGPGREGG